ncbi:MAG TPA: hypothetical protein VG992_01990 [Candidatus Saccharimonadales bacterium]|nr:hypothetical protein [Candidatus Saccharimonadales bacterium]
MKRFASLRFLQRSLAILLVLGFIGGHAGITWAATQSDKPVGLPDSEINALTGWANWVATGGGGACDTATVTTATGLPQDVVDAINKLKPIYEKAAEATGVPWQLLAAVHYREANNNPNEDLQAGNPIGGGGGQQAGYPYGRPTSLEQSAEFAGKQLTSMSKTEGVVKKAINVSDPDPEAVKDTLFSYNGRADVYAQQAADLGFSAQTQPYEGSPYVMNQYDDKHHNMKIITTDNGPLDGVDTRFGAFTVYSLLGGNSSSLSDCTAGAVAGNAVATAMNYAWPTFKGYGYVTMKQSYKEANAAAIAAGEYVGGDSGYPGIDCGAFVTRVMINSGADPNYNYGAIIAKGAGGTPNQQAYMDAHPELYQRLGPQTGTENLKPGDIAINSEHTFMYVGPESDHPDFHGPSASASLGTPADVGRAPMADGFDYGDGAGPFIWYRLISSGDQGN